MEDDVNCVRTVFYNGILSSRRSSGNAIEMDLRHAAETEENNKNLEVS